MQLTSQTILAASLTAATAAAWTFSIEPISAYVAVSSINQEITPAAGVATSYVGVATSYVGDVTSYITRATACASVANSLASVANSFPTAPPGPLRDYLRSHPVADVCVYTTLVPSSLSSSYSSYTSAVRTWYSSFTSDVAVAVQTSGGVTPGHPGLILCDAGVPVKGVGPSSGSTPSSGSNAVQAKAGNGATRNGIGVLMSASALIGFMMALVFVL